MPETLLLIELLTDAIFSRTSATIGVPASLDAPPGATLLGAVAAGLYRALPEKAFAATQLGGLRFSDGLPVRDGAVAVPVPLSWHREKGAAAGDVVDLSHPAASRRRDVQYAQLRGDYVVGAGPAGGELRQAAVPRRSSMRTAMSDAGTAREGLLYGFEAVSRGESFLVRASADDAEVLAQAVGLLTGAPVHLGRSRGAEYGACTVSVATDLPWPQSRPTVDGPLRLLCLSDLALRDPLTGQPTLTPTGAACGLPEGYRFNAARSFLRTRRYSPFNGARRRPDLERQVIVAGSVLVWSAPPGAAAPDAGKLARGIGEYTSAGLGQVVANPEVLDAARLKLPRAPAGPPAAASAAPPLPAGDPLVDWLHEQHRTAKKLDKSWEVAAEHARAASAWGVPASQWGNLRTLARGYAQRPDDPPTRAALVKAAQALCEGVSADAWGARAAELFGTVTRARARAPQVVAAPAAGNPRNPNVHRQGARVDAVDHRSPEISTTYESDGLLSRWQADESIHFARTVEIFARRAVRPSPDAPSPPGAGA